MAIDDLQDKLELFDEYFSIECPFTVNVKPLAYDPQCSVDEFLNQVPLPFKMATELSTIDDAALIPLQTIQGVAAQLTQYLNLQAQKIDLLMNFIINQQDEPEYRHRGNSYSGSGVSFISNKPFAISSFVELKVFINNDNCNIYAWGEVIAQEHSELGVKHKVLFCHIREEDRELLVRTTLRQQQKQLKNLAEKRKAEQNSLT